MINSDETMMFLSFIRMGLQMDILKGLSLEDISKLFVFTQQAHLQKRIGKELTPDDRDIARADYIREKLAHLN